MTEKAYFYKKIFGSIRIKQYFCGVFMLYNIKLLCYTTYKYTIRQGVSLFDCS